MRFLAPSICIAALLSGCQHAAKLPDGCYQPPESGVCRAAIQRYYYDEASLRCRAFIWGGCEGSVPFDTLEQCQQACLPATEEPAP